MNSIKKKLFIQIGTLIILLVGLLFLANSYLLKPYYMEQQKKQLLTAYEEINKLIPEEYDDSLQDFVSIEAESNIDIFIFNVENGVLYTSNAYMMKENIIHDFKKMIPPKPNDPKPNPPLKINREEPINDNVQFLWADDLITGHQNLLLSGYLDNGNYINLRISLLAVDTSIALANHFLLAVGSFLFVFSMVFAFVISKKFTKPILEMNEATSRMKNLDFNTSCKVLSNDEIGQLSQSINEMSVELANTIHSLHDSNEELQKEIKEKIKIDEKRQQLLNNVSHELKTPLALMQGYAEGLKLNVAKDKDRTDFYCDVIIDETNKMNQLVQSLLNINQIEFDKETLHKTEFEIVDFVEYILEKYTPKFQDNNIKWTIDATLPTMVWADLFRTEQVITNYLNNAIQYVNNEKCIDIKIIKDLDHVRIEVFNTTDEINEEELIKLWDSFYKLDKARTRDLGGHGLGLSIVKAIQAADNNGYGSRIEKGGITFWFEVDLNNPSES